ASVSTAIRFLSASSVSLARRPVIPPRATTGGAVGSKRCCPRCRDSNQSQRQHPGPWHSRFFPEPLLVCSNCEDQRPGNSRSVAYNRSGELVATAHLLLRSSDRHNRACELRMSSDGARRHGTAVPIRQTGRWRLVNT